MSASVLRKMARSGGVCRHRRYCRWIVAAGCVGAMEDDLYLNNGANRRSKSGLFGRLLATEVVYRCSESFLKIRPKQGT